MNIFWLRTGMNFLKLILKKENTLLLLLLFYDKSNVCLYENV